MTKTTTGTNVTDEMVETAHAVIEALGLTEELFLTHGKEDA